MSSEVDVVVYWRHGARIDVCMQCVGDNELMSDSVENLLPMDRIREAGEDDGSVFETRLTLKEGPYRIRFLVDGGSTKRVAYPPYFSFRLPSL